jgi:hypothetical protein
MTATTDLAAGGSDQCDNHADNERENAERPDNRHVKYEPNDE